jgi:hypothetical protein
MTADFSGPEAECKRESGGTLATGTHQNGKHQTIKLQPSTAAFHSKRRINSSFLTA